MPKKEEVKAVLKNGELYLEKTEEEKEEEQKEE